MKEYSLEENFDRIKSKSRTQWKREVANSVESLSRRRLQDECHETKLGQTKVKTKTAYVLTKVESEHYKRKVMEPIHKLNRHEAKVLILSRFHMLECGKNFKGTLPEICPECNVADDEPHRLNHCARFRAINLCDSTEKVCFDDIYETDVTTVKKAITSIEKVWNLKTGHGNMFQTN